jgi:hypothetical protein
MKKIKIHYTKILRYLTVKFRKYLSSKGRVLIDENELKGKSIALRLITDPNSDLRICPETFTKYVENEKLNFALIFKDNSIEFFNDHLYTVYFCERNYKSIVQVFNKHAAKDRQVLDYKIRSRVKHSFDDMYNNICKNNNNENSNI